MDVPLRWIYSHCCDTSSTYSRKTDSAVPPSGTTTTSTSALRNVDDSPSRSKYDFFFDIRNYLNYHHRFTLQMLMCCSLSLSLSLPPSFLVCVCVHSPPLRRESVEATLKSSGETHSARLCVCVCVCVCVTEGDRGGGFLLKNTVNHSCEKHCVTE